MILPVLSLVNLGCDGSSNPVDPPSRYDYLISGAIIVDNNDTAVDNDSSHVAIKLSRNSTSIIDAELVFDNNTLIYNLLSNSSELAYTLPNSFTGFLAPQNYALSISDGTAFTDNLTITVPDFSSVIAYNPDSTTTYNPNNGHVTFEWTASLNIDGYVVAAVPVDSAYTGFGYSAFVTTQGNLATFPPQAFRTADESGVLPGNYYLYVYGYKGAPDVNLSSTYLPVPFPSQIPDNIDRTRLGGHIGTIVVSKRVPLTVVGG